MKRRFILGGTVLLLVSQTLAQEAPDKIVEYKTIGEVKLALHIFNPTGHQVKDNRAAIVFFFGGGWVVGTPTQFYKQSRYLASRGMVSICAEYRTNRKHNTSPKECVKDGKSAIRWIRRHADELGVDPKRVAAGGGSAGGHIAAAAGTLSGFNEDGDDTTVSCRPDLLVLFNPVFDNSADGFGYKRVSEYWQDFSPMHNIDRNTPPTIVFLGTEDKLIPVATAIEYKQRMKKVGVPCDLHLYKGQSHGFFNKARYYETLLETDKFLAFFGYLDGEPTLQNE